MIPKYSTALQILCRKINSQFASGGVMCFYCGDTLGSTKDHFIPVSKGGSQSALNLVPCCFPCNAAKASRWPTFEQTRKFVELRPTVPAEYLFRKDFPFHRKKWFKEVWPYVAFFEQQEEVVWFE